MELGTGWWITSAGNLRTGRARACTHAAGVCAFPATRALQHVLLAATTTHGLTAACGGCVARERERSDPNARPPQLLGTQEACSCSRAWVGSGRMHTKAGGSAAASGHGRQAGRWGAPSIAQGRLHGFAHCKGCAAHLSGAPPCLSMSQRTAHQRTAY